MLTIRELQELRQVQDNRKALTDRYGIGIGSSISQQSTNSSLQQLSAWDPIKNRPLVLIQNTGTDPIALDSTTPRQDITKKIVFQKPFPQQVPQQTQKSVIDQSSIQQRGPLLQNIMHEYHHRERAYQLKSVEDILRPWRAKEIMYKRQIQSLQNQIDRGAYTIQKKNTLQVENIPKKVQLQTEIEKLDAILTNKHDEIMRLKILSQELETKQENIEISSSQEFVNQEKQLEGWKQKFKELNNLYHECQEECTMKETEIESMKNRKLSVVKQQTVQTKAKSKFQKDEKNVDSPRARISTVSDKDSDYY